MSEKETIVDSREDERRGAAALGSELICELTTSQQRRTFHFSLLFFFTEFLGETLILFRPSVLEFWYDINYFTSSS